MEQLIKSEGAEKMTSDQYVWLCAIMISATIVKSALWLYCRSSGNEIVRAYAKVHTFCTHFVDAYFLAVLLSFLYDCIP